MTEGWRWIAPPIIATVVVGGVALAKWAVQGPFVDGSDAAGSLIVMWLWVAAPFALIAYRDMHRTAWGVALGCAIALWGWYAIDALLGLSGPGVNMGLALLLLISPILIALIAFAADLIAKRARNARQAQ